MKTTTFKLLAILFVTSALLTACKQPANQSNTDIDMTQSSTAAAGEVINQSMTDEQGNTLDMTFDNARDVVIIEFKGETAELASQRPASGIWYANDEYELRGKGENYTLIKDGTTVFEN